MPATLLMQLLLLLAAAAVQAYSLTHSLTLIHLHTHTLVHTHSFTHSVSLSHPDCVGHRTLTALPWHLVRALSAAKERGGGEVADKKEKSSRAFAESRSLAGDRVCLCMCVARFAFLAVF